MKTFDFQPGLLNQLWILRAMFVRNTESLSRDQVNTVLLDQEYPVVRELTSRKDFVLDEHVFDMMVNHSKTEVQNMLIEHIKKNNLTESLSEDQIKRLVLHKDQHVRLSVATNLPLDMKSLYIKHGVCKSGASKNDSERLLKPHPRRVSM